MPDTNPAIGTLRWPVTVAQRGQAADPVTMGIVETFRDILEVRADIQPVGSLTFYAGMQVDVRATHIVTLRFLDWIDTTHVVFRRSLRPDQTVREEMFRIHRIREIEGRKRFVALDCELEKRADG
jgi:head-tail adaptor